MPEQYTDLEVRVRSVSGDGNGYPVEGRLGGRLDGEGEMDGDLRKRLLQVLDPQVYGRELFQALFGGGMRQVYFRALERAKQATDGRLRVRLLIEAPELHALHWERLYYIRGDQTVPLAALTSTPFSRQLREEGDIATELPKAPIRMLVAVSNPAGLPGREVIQVEVELESLREALGDLPRLGQVQVTLLPGRTPLHDLGGQLEKEGYAIVSGVTSRINLTRLLRDGDYHVFHFLGHGHFQAKEDVASLLLEHHGPPEGLTTPAKGAQDWVVDGELEAMFAGLDAKERPRLVFLAACESARRDPEGAFTGLAPKLIRAGVPAVVAMQDRVEQGAARRLTGEFYRRLLEHGVVDRALNEARNLLFGPDDVMFSWAIPALFTHSGASEQLFQPNPIRNAQQKILQWAQEKTRNIPVPMPLEVVHLQGAQDLASVRKLGRGGSASVDMLSATRDILTEVGKYVVLTSDRGTARTSQLYHLVRLASDSELAKPSSPPVLPVYVDLANNYPPTEVGANNPVEVLILDILKEFWPGLDARTLADLRQSEPDLTLWVLLDGSDDLPFRQRTEVWDQVAELASAPPEHTYLLTLGLANYVPRLLKEVTDVLVIQPLSQRAIETFLTRTRDRALYRALQRTRLFDLASTPWLLAEMLRRARRDIYPESRAKVLENLIEDAIARIEISHNIRIRTQAAPILYALVYRMKHDRVTMLDISTAFRTMATVRGNREYNLEEMCEELVRIGILVRAGDKIGFAYPAYEDYCAARAIEELASEEQDRALADIAASMSRLSRLRVWEGTLVLLSGMMDDPNVVLEQLLYGASFGDRERVHVAARCLLEAGRKHVKERLWDRVVDALIWRLSPDNVQQPALRERAAQALGELEDRSAIPYLARAANARVRAGRRRTRAAHEYSNVRMAATMALRRFVPRYMDDIRKVDPRLAELLSCWNAESVPTLSTWLRSGSASLGALAAFALADLYLEGITECLDVLIDVFREAGGAGATRWAVADALTLLDATVVTRRAILPLIDAAVAKEEGLTGSEVWRRRALQYERLAYLIGYIRAPDPRARAFLHDRLKNDGRVYVKGRSIQALGALYDRDVKDLLERIANADWADLSLPSDFSAGDEHYLRRKAIEALAFVGDESTLEALEKGRAGWTPELRRAFYESSEEIVWRQGVERLR